MRTRFQFSESGSRFFGRRKNCIILFISVWFALFQAQAQYNTNPPAAPVRLVFIHHSVGEGWLSPWGGGLLDALNRNNYYVHDTNYDWGPEDQDTPDGSNIGSHTDIGHWFNWFLGPNRTTYLNALYNDNDLTSGIENSASISDPGGENNIVMFKSCFLSVQSINGRADDAPTPKGMNNILYTHGVSDDSLEQRYTVANIKGMYRDLLDYFATRQDKLFVLCTSPPSHVGYADDAMPKLRAINNWLVNEWLSAYPHNNVTVFDFSAVMTSNGGDPETNDLGKTTGSHHRFSNGKIEHVLGADPFLAYASYDPSTSTWDNHPTPAGGEKASFEFLPLLNIAYNRWKNTQILSAPVLISPVNKAVNIAHDTVLTWNPGKGAAKYQLQLSTDVTFNTTFLDESGITATSFHVTGLEGSTKYYWHVKASNDSAASAFSSAWSFTTVMSAPPSPDLVEPADNALSIPLSVSLIWKPVTDASGYRVQLATDSLFSNIFTDHTTVAAVFDFVWGLAPGTIHYWRVNATNPGGIGPWSGTWRFTTESVNAIDGDVHIPEGSALFQNYPNPFTNSTSIKYRLAARDHVRLEVCDLFGRRIATLADEETDAGEHVVPFESDKNVMIPGLYFYRLTVRNASIMRAMIVLR